MKHNKASARVQLREPCLRFPVSSDQAEAPCQTRKYYFKHLELQADGRDKVMSLLPLPRRSGGLRNPESRVPGTTPSPAAPFGECAPQPLLRTYFCSLHSEGPHRTCNQGNSGQRQLVLSSPPDPVAKSPFSPPFLSQSSLHPSTLLLLHLPSARTCSTDPSFHTHPLKKIQKIK